MIFAIRVVVFTFLIVIGFATALKRTILYKTVTFIYIFTLLWYTLLCRLMIFTRVPVNGGDIAHLDLTTSYPSSGWDKIWELIRSIFGTQPDGYLAGSGVAKGMSFNAMLFIPLGYLLLFVFPQLRGSKRGRVRAILISMVISLMIESIQEITSLGIADWKDVLGNTIGAAVGVGMVIIYDWYFSFRNDEPQSSQL